MENTFSNSNDALDIEIESFPQVFIDALFNVKMDNTVNSQNFMDHMLKHYNQVKKLALELNVPNGAAYCDIHIRGTEACLQLRRQRGA